MQSLILNKSALTNHNATMIALSNPKKNWIIIYKNQTV